MTRAIYTKCRTYPEIAQQLIDSHPNQIIENNNTITFGAAVEIAEGKITTAKY